MTKTAIAVGSNLGDRLAHLRAAHEGLASIGSIMGVSSLYETAPVGGPAQGRYLNAVVLVDTDLPALELLSRLQEIERSSRRVRGERWGPRTLDLDLVAWEADPVSLPALSVPHPRAAERRFVLEPLADVWPDAPVAPGLSATEALALVGDQDVKRWHGAWQSETPHLGPAAGRWVIAQVILFLVWGVILVATAGVPIPAWRGLIGGALSGAALILGAAAIAALGRELTPYPQPRPGASLVATGPYRLVRHPIYGSIALGFAGVAILFGSLPSLVGALAIAVFFRSKSAVEEQALAIGIPDYPRYRHTVRRRFIPFLW